ncbi:murein transglycosylase A [Sphingomicrobium astaxanthinifaciens]|uniref:murein transglycosylase A n=1 Tax=Sphingomicrobium astaxanthinifaciens TaxID=1227949 RepID=UPI001FCC655A|nr:MltA domain-containing protein [Sphingomicrobium astaxanthinifaciens]MCJ7422118.1 MltA domain-containing protein [Sphingomicrobium astaxanthinifaciens]
MSGTSVARVAGAWLALMLGACAASPQGPSASASAPAPTPAPAPVPAAATALEAGVRLAAAIAPRGEEARRALEAFVTSCPKLLARTDSSLLTLPADWAPLCAEARTLDPARAADFFAARFAWIEVGDGRAFATGYFEPEIDASPVPTATLSAPVYALPDDLTQGVFSDGSGEGRGRRDANGDFVRYFDRAAIDAGALAGRGLELGYADPVDLFFLQIQGSGRLRMPDGEVVRIGYAGQNGHEYVAIGRLLRERGLMESGTITLDSLQEWLRADPVRGTALMQENPSYVFFRRLEGEGPLGALEVPVVPVGSVAADPRFVPLGAPVWLDLDNDAADGLWVAQDTGGAIKGANRFDTFWGAGPAAKRIAGVMSSEGRALLLLPRTAVARALARP